LGNRRLTLPKKEEKGSVGKGSYFHKKKKGAVWEKKKNHSENQTVKYQWSGVRGKQHTTLPKGKTQGNKVLSLEGCEWGNDWTQGGRTWAPLKQKRGRDGAIKGRAWWVNH